MDKKNGGFSDVELSQIKMIVSEAIEENANESIILGRVFKLLLLGFSSFVGFLSFAAVLWVVLFGDVNLTSSLFVLLVACVFIGAIYLIWFIRLFKKKKNIKDSKFLYYFLTIVAIIAALDFLYDLFKELGIII